jgi:hypothetical protein
VTDRGTTTETETAIETWTRREKNLATTAIVMTGGGTTIETNRETDVTETVDVMTAGTTDDHAPAPGNARIAESTARREGNLLLQKSRRNKSLLQGLPPLKMRS